MPKSLIPEPRPISQAICDLFEKAAATGDAKILDMAKWLYNYALTRKRAAS